MCGELGVACRRDFHTVGSSPRVWGTLGIDLQDGDLVRFIPACVGNSQNRLKHATMIAVHPRVCGELRSQDSRVLCDLGSSPRVWGTPGTHTNQQYQLRFIPACVGNSLIDYGNNAKYAVHPRVCGELFMVIPLSVNVAGSSPRVWGTHR